MIRPDGASKRKVGIVAGWGSFPVEVAQDLHSAGCDVYVVALKQHADPSISQYAAATAWKGVLKIGGHMRFFRRHGVEQVVLAGKLFKDRILYHGLGWLQHVPDITCLSILGGSFVTKTRDGRDDTVLSAIVDAYGKRNMEILTINDVAPRLLAAEGTLTKAGPSRSDRLDVEFGWNIARKMGQLDIGQAITVKDQVVLGVEAIEGTDGLIARTGKLCPRGGFTLIKIAKPNQDMRFDVPTVGKRTIEQLVRAGGRTLAIEAGRTILVDRDETLDYANRHGISIVAMPEGLDHSNLSKSAA